MIPLPKIPKPPTDGGPRWFQIAIALSMVVSTLSAVYGSIKTSLTMEALVKENTRLVMANSTPLLEFSSGNYDNKEFALNFTVNNVGNGPARMVWFQVKGDGKPFPDLTSLLKNRQPELELQSLLLLTGTVAPRLISSGKEFPMFKWTRPAPTKNLELAAWNAFDQYRQQGKITVQACYCSVLDACWTSTLEGDIPKPVASCQAIQP